MATPSEPLAMVIRLKELMGKVLSEEHEEKGCVGVVRDEFSSL
jgi:hypothetical protein